ncbi:xanthine oxidase [Nitzschia inconspicua]|uniref:Xanthine oxidase n=1 Tax=Nitzschia inconspicua TaxID=303405 RepID=A0A9K3LLD3_9STRA|nr:xanthine oxidase [Nitzschia inconspicua]
MAPNARSRLLYENDDLERVNTFEKQGYRTSPILYVNGSRVPDDVATKARSNQTLLSFLRDEMKLKGSKLGCAEGGCGACTVMISKKDKESGELKHIAVNACLMPALAADGCHVTTVEGVGSVKGDNLHPIQKAMVEMHGSQCGFCTPGIIVAIYSLYANKCNTKEIEEHMDGNLCRCTGYRPIWDAARSLCDDAEELVRGPCGIPCRECNERDVCEQDCNLEDKQKETVIITSSKDKMKMKESLTASTPDWMDQPKNMFPDDLLDASSADSLALAKPLMVVDNTEFHGAGTWFKPTTLTGLLKLLKEFGDPVGGGYKIVVGNTEVGIETRFKNSVYPRLIYPGETVESIYQVTAMADTVVFGGCAPLSYIQHESERLSRADSSYTRTLMPIHDMLRWFASTQIRNVACLGGNLVTASPISDMNPMLASMGATLVLSKLGDDLSTIERRHVPVSEFFLRYRTVDIQSSEFVERIEVPVLSKFFEYVKPFKQARRREDDISIVTSGMHIKLAPTDGTFVIEHAALAFGGMAPTTVMAPKTAQVLVGSPFTRETFDRASDVLFEELKLPENVPGGQAAFRMALANSFLYKFFLSVVEELRSDVEAIEASPGDFSLPLPGIPEVDEAELSGASSFVSAEKPSVSGVQTFPAPKVASGLEDKLLPNTDAAKQKGAVDVVGKPSTHQSGPLHCTGEATYCDDIIAPTGTLHASLILAREAGVIFEDIDREAALNTPGVVGVFGAEDIEMLGGENMNGPVAKDEYFFLPIGERIGYVGQVLGVSIGETLDSAEAGAKAAKIKYGPSNGIVPVSIEDAIACNSFYEMTRHTIARGDKFALDALKNVEDTSGDVKVGDLVKVSGSFRSGAQEHFYLETQSTLVVPTEGDTNLTVYSSTQAATHTQESCASATGTPQSKVVVRVKRMGGGFGGKETRNCFASGAAAVAAKRLNKPVLLTLPRDVDMLTTGHRHCFMSKYHATARITEDGAKLESMYLELYSNGGWGMDLSGPIVDRAILHSDGVYYFPNMEVHGVACKTAQAPHTAYRGFGGPQGIAACEHVIEHLAVACNVHKDDLRRANMYTADQSTHFGMLVGQTSGKWNVPSIWDRMVTELKIPHRRREIDKFNTKHKWLKRGAALIPTKFGIAFTAPHMNQGGALVHLYTDGTVLVSHGGTEMGQGLHTKVCQVAAQAFGIPIERVYVNDTSTDKVANTIASAASMSTDLYGMCTLDACRQIMGRLKPYREKLGPDASLADIAHAAHFDRVDLSAHGFYAPDSSMCNFNMAKEKPDDFPLDKPENSWKGRPFNYFTQGVAYAEVEIDVLTGNHRTLRADVVVDVGSSINPAIDIGQIEGAFFQGMGWSTIEEIIYSDDDHTWFGKRSNLFTQGPGTYKIPAFNDHPEVFNVSLLEDVDNPLAVHSSKAIGEPPFFLGSSVFYAIKDAVGHARKEVMGKDSYFEFRMPGTSERIRMQTNDAIGMKAKTAILGDEKAAETYQTQGSY